MSATLRIVVAAERAIGALLVALLAAPSGLGLLYLLRNEGLLPPGRRLAGALPLQALAGGAAQPLVRVTVAFALAGAAAGLLLGLLTRVRPWRLAAAAGALAWALLVLGGAASDAVENSGRVVPRLVPQLRHHGLWAELAALLLGLLVGLWAARRARAAGRFAPAQQGHAPWEHGRAAQLVAEHGRDPLDPFALRADKAFHFAAGGVLAYRVIGRTAVVAGDPIGPPGSAAAVLDSFAAYAARRGWGVCATGISPAGLAALGGCGFHALEIGAEALVDPRAFGLEGRRVRKVRQAVARVERAGWTVEARPARTLAAPTVAELDGVEQRWRARQRRLCGFAMTLGRLWGAPEDLDAVYVLARDPAGALCAFLRFAPYRSGGGLSLDAMRRGMAAEPNGLGETMVVEALRWAAAEGIAEVSLNFAGFAHVMAVDRSTLGLRRRLLRVLLRALHGRFQLERLARFNAKFLPTWQSRYLLYRRRRELPLAGWRVLQAEAYLRPPAAASLPLRWEPDRLPAVPAPAPAEVPVAAAVGSVPAIVSAPRPLPALAGVHER
jgi:lysyl-tRNA synthetase class 2